MKTSQTNKTTMITENKNNDAKTYIMNILTQLDLNKITNIQILDFIAEGGFGIVSTCKYLGTEFLIKTLKIIETKAYMDEFKLTYKFRNSGIPKVIAAFESTESKSREIKDENLNNDDNEAQKYDKDIGVIFEFIKGIALNSVLYKKEKGKKKKNDLPISLITKLDWLVQMCSCIEFLHDHNLVHRDLKPDNIIIDNINCLKVLDFGISIKNNTEIDLMSGQNCYTMKYVPVDLKYMEINGGDLLECNKNKTETEKVVIPYKITTSFDVWCVGLIISEVLSGVEPWNGKSEDKIINSIIMIDEETKNEFEYPIPNESKFDITKDHTKKEIIYLIRDCTKFNPDERPKMDKIKKKLWELFEYEVKTDYQSFIALQNKDKNLFEKETKSIVKALKNKVKKQKEMKFEDPLNLLFRNINKKLKTEITIINEKLTEIENDKLEQLENKENDAIKGNIYAYLTYNEFDDSIIGITFPENKSYVNNSVMKGLFGDKNYKFKNPFCLNHNNRLYILGGFIIDNKSQEEKNQSNENNNISSKFKTKKDLKIESYQKQNEYLEIFGNNYNTCRKVIRYNFNDNKVSELPSMIHSRGHISSIIYKGFLFAMGDGNTVEMLNITSLEKSNQVTLDVWEIFCTLPNYVYSPILVNKSNEFLYIISLNQNYLEILLIKGMKKNVSIRGIDLDKPYFLKGVYYNFAIEDVIYLFLSYKSDFDNSEKFYCLAILATAINKNKFENNYYIYEVFPESPFNSVVEKTLKKISFTNIKFNENNPNEKCEDNIKLFNNTFFIHNNSEFYYYDEVLYYYSLNPIKTGLSLRKFPVSLFK